ncbi:MAG: hypothetical protein AAGF83_05615 [Cyanobacteria bacterium P01_G01_bin.67]
MNMQVFSNHSKQILFTVIAVSSMNLAVSPAQADDALIQESVQESVVTGRDNISVQNSNQSNQQYSVYRDRRKYGHYGYDNYQDQSSTGIVQRSDQYCDQVGEYNSCVQDAQQSNTSYNRRERRSRY